MRKLYAIIILLTATLAPAITNASEIFETAEVNIDYNVSLQKIGTLTDGYTKLAEQAGSPVDNVTFNNIDIGLKKVGSPDGSLTLKIYGYNNDVPLNPEYGTLFKTVSIDESAISTTCSTQTYPLNITLENAPKLWLVLEYNGTPSDTDYFVWCGEEHFSGSANWQGNYDGSSWFLPSFLGDYTYIFYSRIYYSMIPPVVPDTGFIKVSNALAFATTTASGVGTNVASLVPALGLVGALPLVFYIGRKLIIKI